MVYTCYYCNKEWPKSQMKSCARCLIVTYCSKECQTKSWKYSHKMNCRTHPSKLPSTDPGKIPERPPKYSLEWLEHEQERAFSRWIELWRPFLQTWTGIALNLANHPPERVMTHCMKITVQTRNFLSDTPTTHYRVLGAEITTLSDVEATSHLEFHVDPTDFTRMRFVLFLQNYQGEVMKRTLIEWNDVSADKWQDMDKAASARLEVGWAEVLVHTLNTMTPKEADEMLRAKCATRLFH